MHRAGKGAKYLRGKAFTLAWFAWVGEQSHACKAEYKIKQLTHKNKLALVATAPSNLPKECSEGI